MYGHLDGLLDLSLGVGALVHHAERRHTERVLRRHLIRRRRGRRASGRDESSTSSGPTPNGAKSPRRALSVTDTAVRNAERKHG